MTGVTVTRVDDRLIAVKPADPADPDRRRREAALLVRLDHPGVVQFVDLVDGDEPELRLEFAGTDTWARTPPTGDAAIVGGLAAVASTVADLHDLGTAHRALRLDHVIVAADRRPVLCGLADAAPADPTTCAADVRALAELIEALARGASDGVRRALDDLTARARSGELSARGVTEGLDSIRTAPDKRERQDRRLDPPLPVGGGTLVAVILITVGAGLALAVALWPRSRPVDEPSAAPAPPAAPPVDPAARPVEPARLDDGEPLVIVHAGRRVAVGRIGDQVLMGDWDCDGEPTPAVFDPTTGTIARFDRWPAPGATASPGAVAVAPEATGIELVADPPCDRLRVVHRDGSTFFTEDT